MKKISMLLPHKFPFIFVDKIVGYKKHKYLCAIKTIKEDDFFLKIHYPNNPVFPGSLILETIAQSSSLLEFLSKGKLKFNEIYYICKISKLKFIHPVYFNNRMMVHVFTYRSRNNVSAFKGFIVVKDRIICKYHIMCARKIIG